MAAEQKRKSEEDEQRHLAKERMALEKKMLKDKLVELEKVEDDDGEEEVDELDTASDGEAVAHEPVSSIFNISAFILPFPTT